MFEILGYIFVVVLAGVLLTQFVIHMINLFKTDNLFVSIDIEHSIWWSTMEGFYIIPTIKVLLTKWLCIDVFWLGICYSIAIHIKTEEEEDACAEAMRNLRKK